MNGVPLVVFLQWDGSARQPSSRAPSTLKASPPAAIPTASIIGAVVHAAARVRDSLAGIELIKADRLLLGLPSGASDPDCTAATDALRRGGVNALEVEDIRGEDAVEASGATP